MKGLLLASVQSFPFKFKFSSIQIHTGMLAVLSETEWNTSPDVFFCNPITGLDRP
jgi:hypothetical protein